MKPKFTIKKKIVLWFSISLLVIEAIMLSLTFTIGQSVFSTDIQSQLATQVEANVQEVEFYNSLKNQEIEMGDQFLSYKDGYLEIDDDFCDYISGIYTCLVDEKNDLLYGECPIRLTSSQAFSFTTVDTLKYKGERYYVYEQPLSGEGLEGLWLRGVASQREGTNLLYSIMRLVILLLPLLAVISVVGGYLLTRRSLAPMDDLISTAENIDSGDDLSRRIELGPGSDEVHQLASTFNHMLDRLESSFQRERQFTSDASHELRTPMAVILSQCEFSLELAETEEDYREALTVIQQQAVKIKELISQLLFFTRLEQGHQVLQLAETDLSSLVETACAEAAAAHSSATTDAPATAHRSEEGASPATHISTADHHAPDGGAAGAYSANGLQDANDRSRADNANRTADAQASAHNAAAATGAITMALDIEPGIYAQVDQTLFARLLTNLINNAYQYGRPGGHILVSLRQSYTEPDQDLAHMQSSPTAIQSAGNADSPSLLSRVGATDNADSAERAADAIILSVRDDGIGIDRENLSRIWDRFYQVDPARTASDEAGGAGLGLSMVKDIAALHHGKIEVESAPGKGSTFTLILPQ